MNKIISLFCLMPFIPLTSFADCGLALTASNISITWNLNFNFQSILVTINKTKKPACSFGLGFTKGSAGDYSTRSLASGGNSLTYQLFGDVGLTQILKDVPDITSSAQVVTGSFSSGANQSQTATYYMQIPSTSPLKPPGTYQDSFLIHLYEGSNPLNFNNADATASVTLSTIIPRMLEISLVSSGGGFNTVQTSQTINFGTLSPSGGQSLGFDMLIRSNAGYVVSYSSQNDGVMKNTNPAIATTVPYTLQVNSATKNLVGSSSIPVSVATGTGQSSLTGTLHNVTVSNGSSESAMAGTYSDIITVTSATTE